MVVRRQALGYRKRAEDEIRNMTGFLNSIIENIPMMLFVKEARELRFERLVSSMPFPDLVRAAKLDHDTGVFRSNKVLVLNLGFNRKGARGVH